MFCWAGASGDERLRKDNKIQAWVHELVVDCHIKYMSNHHRINNRCTKPGWLYQSVLQVPDHRY